MAIIIGDDKNNTLNGTSVDDAIIGKGGNDTLRGLGGNDFLLGDGGGDSGNDSLFGGAGNDVLDGGEFTDELTGGTGNDIYYVGPELDYVIELAGEGTDEVRSTSGDTLAANVENLTLIGDYNQSGTGNALDNVIQGNAFDNRLSGLDGGDTLRGAGGNDALDGGTGNDLMYGDAGSDELDGGLGNDLMYGGAGNDVLDGGIGNDSMYGGAGSDIYYVGRTGDRVIELGREGTDEVRSTLRNYTLGANVEHLTFIGTGAFNGTGNGLGNIIQGANGNDTLIGGAGNDTLRGNLGIDTAVFAGLSTDYTISTVNGITTVIDNKATTNGNDGRDTLTGVDRLQFLDRTISIEGANISQVNLNDLNGTIGFTLVGADAGDGSGFSVSSAGDVNGDGFDDIIIGAPAAESGGGTSNQGESYLVFGKGAWTGTPVMDLASLNGLNGVRLIGLEGRSGTSVSSAGDINGDGFDDVIVGAPNFYGGSEYPGGESYVVFGKANWSGSAAVDLGTLDGNNGFSLTRDGVFPKSGYSVSSAGDVNGDGFDDLIIGSPEFGLDPYGAGKSYVVFGKANWSTTPEIDLDELDGTDGFRLAGVSGISLSGWSVSSAGDVNGDGFDDVIVGAPDVFIGSEPYGEGQSYVVFGKANWASTPLLSFADLNGTNGFRLAGTDPYDSNGHSVSGAGDINGDGFADVVVAAPFAGDSAAPSAEGEAYVIFGKANWAGTPSIDAAALNGANGFRLAGIDISDTAGISVSSAGDVNGDGYADLIIGASRAERRPGGSDDDGESYVVYGKANWSETPVLYLATLDGSNGFRLSGADIGDRSGDAVSAGGDVNGDGFADLIVGAPYAESAGGAANEGESYVVFGGNFSGAVAHLGTAGNNTLNGTAASENFVGGAGNDMLNSGGGTDAFQGGTGNDTIRLSGANFLHIDGGRGNDGIALAGSGLTLDLTAIRPERIQSIERIDLTGTGNNTLRLSVADVLDLSDESNALLVAGNAGDSVIRGAGWTMATSGGSNGNGTSTIGGQTYRHYNAGQASLLVDTDIGTAIA